MMKMEWVQLCGKSIRTIRNVKMNEKGIDVYYNYFEDNS